MWDATGVVGYRRHERKYIMKISTIVCNFSNVKVGDSVYSIRYGNGTVCDVFKELFFINFENFTKSFTFNGLEAEYKDKHPSLFWTEPELEGLPKKCRK